MTGTSGESTPVRVRTASGWLVGRRSADGVERYSGIPYALPPVGELRWRAPRPHPGWEGDRLATEFGSACIQPDRAENSIGFFGRLTDQSEDCLYVNVWTPTSRAPGAPVLVWLHGGAFEVGANSLPIFDGAGLARKGLVVVTVNYRLGRLGFLAHPALSAESPERVSGNYGIRDQIAALEWVRDHIEAFGGDPGLVTIAGQSVGGSSVSLLMASASAAGLFHRAIIQSGGALGPVGTTAGMGDGLQDLAHAEASGAAMARAWGADDAPSLRRLSPELVQFSLPGAISDTPQPLRGPGSFDTAWAIADGVTVQGSVWETFAAGRQADVPLISGCTSDDASIIMSDTAAGLETKARELFGAAYPDFARLYPHGDDSEAVVASRRFIGDRTFAWQVWAAAKLHASTSTSGVWHYRFDHISPVPDGVYSDNAGRPITARQLGAFHGVELPYEFAHLDVRDWAWSATDREISERMAERWIAFARSGDPNSGSAATEWPRFDPTDPRSLRIGDRETVTATPDREQLELWDRHYELIRHEAR